MNGLKTTPVVLNACGVNTSACLHLKHTTTFFSLSDHYTLSREWRVIVDQVQTNYHGRPIYGAIISQVWLSC